MTPVSLRNILNRPGNGKWCPLAIMVRDGCVLLGHRHYTASEWRAASVWTLPGGRSHKGESVEQALQREVAEEVGITEFEIVDFIGQIAGVKEGDVLLLFYCTTAQEAALMEPEKFSEWRWVPLEDYVADGKYTGFNPPARKMITDYLLKRPPTQTLS